MDQVVAAITGHKIPVGDWSKDAVDWLLAHVGWLFDFITEVLWPGHIRDTRLVHIDLHEAQPAKTDDIIARAEALRSQGRALPLPERPAEPRPRRSLP